MYALLSRKTNIILKTVLVFVQYVYHSISLLFMKQCNLKRPFYVKAHGVPVICISLDNSSSVSEPYFLDMMPWNHFGMTLSFTMWFFWYSVNQAMTVLGVTASAMSLQPVS